MTTTHTSAKTVERDGVLIGPLREPRNLAANVAGLCVGGRLVLHSWYEYLPPRAGTHHERDEKVSTSWPSALGRLSPLTGRTCRRPYW